MITLYGAKKWIQARAVTQNHQRNLTCNSDEVNITNHLMDYEYRLWTETFDVTSPNLFFQIPVEDAVIGLLARRLRQS